MSHTFEELADIKAGTILLDRFEDGVRFIIMRGPASLCAYLGVPESHPLAGMDYDSLPVDCHGGLTFAGTGDNWPKGFYWYGWDYGHSGDKSLYDLKYSSLATSEEKAWTVPDVDSDSRLALWSFKKLMKLAETCAAKASTPLLSPTPYQNGDLY